MNSDSVIGILSWWDGVELWLSASSRGESGSRRRPGGPLMSGMPQSRVTLALVALAVLVIVAWLLSR
ncbi:Uncharacterised protein [Mycobacteroides abscessus subsp. abscessus]|nr:Uncharacterised protein [Mycobacteroides abscessus subsp. abscessus]